MWHYLKILVETLQYQTISDNIRRCLTIFDDIEQYLNVHYEHHFTIPNKFWKLLTILDKKWQYLTILVDILQYLTISDNIRRYLTTFDEILPISNNIREFRPTLARPYCFETFLGWLNNITRASPRTSFRSLKIIQTNNLFVKGSHFYHYPHGE